MIKQVPFQKFVHGKSRNLQKVLRYFGGIVISTFKFGAASGFSSPSFSDHSGIFPSIFVFYLNDLPSEALSLILPISSL